MADGGKVIIKIDGDSSGFEKSAGKLKKIGGTALKGIAVGAAAAATAVAGIGTAAIKSYADYEQLIGGVETLFKESADLMVQNAQNAFKTAGMSANTYMETVTSFSASLIKSVGGDTEKAAQMADMAIQDMADNANKMGTSLDVVRETYQSLARGNYEMLDNLKLGYGGTKAQLELLLSDAEKYMAAQGQIREYSVDSYADIVEAIHVVQEQMGITGTTQLEAATTIQGSLNMVKGAWENLLTGLADPNQNLETLLNDLFGSITIFLENVTPRISAVLSSIPGAIRAALPEIGGIISGFAQQIGQELPGLITEAINSAGDFIYTLPQKLEESLPGILDWIVGFADDIISALPGFIEKVGKALPEIIPQLITFVVEGVTGLLNSLGENLPDMLTGIIEALPDIILSIVDALIENIPVLLEGLNSFIKALVEALPDILTALKDAFVELFLGIWERIKEVFAGVDEYFGTNFSGALENVEAVWGFAVQFFQTIWENIKIIFSYAKTFFGGAFSTAAEAVKAAWNNVTGFFSTLWETIKSIFAVVGDVLSGDFESAWERIKGIFGSWNEYFSGVWEGIQNVFSSAKDWFGETFSAAKEAAQKAWDNVSNFFSGVWEGIKGAFSDTDSWFFQIFGQANINAKKAWDGTKSFFSGIWNEIKEAFADPGAWFREKFTEAVQSVKNVWNGIKEFFKKVGGDIIAGLQEGIEGAVGGLKKKVSGVVNQIKSLFTGITGFNVNSPSKWAEDVGAYVTIGLARGIISKKDYAEDAVYSMLSSMKDKAEDTTQALAKRAGELFPETFAEGMAENEEAATAQFDHLLEVLEHRRKLDLINEADYYEQLKTLRDTYLAEGTKEHAQYTEKIYDYYKGLAEDQAELLEEQKDTIQSIYDEIESYATERYDEIAQAQENIASKLQSFGGLFEEVDFGDLGTFKIFNNFEDEIAVLDEYGRNMQALKDRLRENGYDDGIIQGFFAEFENLDVMEASNMARMLNSKSGAEFSEIVGSWADYQKKVQEVSENLYAEERAAVEKEVEALADFTESELGKYGAKIPEDFFTFGEDSAKQFGEGFLEKLSQVMADINQKISASFGALLPSAAAAGNSYVDNRSTTIIAPAGTSPAALIEQQNQNELYQQHTRGW